MKQQATTLFYQGDMQAAIPLLQQLYTANHSHYYYQYLVQAYVMTKEYTKAQKLIKQHHKDKNYKALFDMAYVAKAKGQNKQANKKYTAALKQMPRNKSAYLSVVNSMRRRGLFDWAENTCLYAQKHMPHESFHLELAYLYQALGKYTLMTDALLSLLEAKPEQEKTIRHKFQYLWRKQSSDSLPTYARTACLKKLQSAPDKIQFRTFLLWMSIQQQDFEMAEMQARALDKFAYTEQKEPHLLVLARVLLNQQRYGQAASILKEIVHSKNVNKDAYYFEAQRGYLHAAFQHLKQAKAHTNSDIAAVKADYDNFLHTLGWAYCHKQTVIDYADLLAHYTHRADSAVLFLQNSLSHLRLQPQDMGAVKLYLGDVYQEVEQPWEATLLYSQIEKDFPHDNLGFEARYRNALLSFYLGEVAWAEAQLDVLKAATDKKIANDAMKWALFITEAKAADTTQQLLRVYGRALQAQSQSKDTLAVSVLDTLLNTTDNAQLQAFFSLQKAQIWLAQQYIAPAKSLLETFVNEYPDSFVADEAIWTLIGLLKATEPEQCASYYKLLITEYPASFFTPQAREAYRKIKFN